MSSEYVTCAQSFTDGFNEWTSVLQMNQSATATAVVKVDIEQPEIPLSFIGLCEPCNRNNVLLRRTGNKLHEYWNELDRSTRIQKDFEMHHVVVRSFDNICISVDTETDTRHCRRKRKR